MSVIISSPMDVTLAIEGKHPLTREELLSLVNGFDGYECREGADERIVVDVKSVHESGTLVLHLCPQYKVSYAEIDQFITRMICEILKGCGLKECSHHIIEITWHIEELGVPSELAPIHVDAPLEEEAPTEPAFTLELGRAYYIEERRNELGLGIFADHLHHGFHGLAITRIYPDHMREEFNLQKTPIVWLTHTEHSDDILATDNLHMLSDLVRNDILGKYEQSIILLSGLEYLTTHAGSRPVLKFLQYLVDQVALHKALLIISLNPSAFSDQEFNLLTRDLIRYEA